MGIEKFRYDGKRALVVGGATGMGAATAKLVQELGGEVIVMDVKPVDYPVDQSITMDLRDRASIDDALGQVSAPIHALFSCAGVSGEPFSPLDVMLINFIGQRHLIEAAVDGDMLPEGSAIGAIASIGGLGWDRNLSTVIEFLETPDFDSAAEWYKAHGNALPDAYGFSKQAFITYAGRRAIPFIQRGIRINTIGPGPTDTPLMQSTPMWMEFGATEFKDKVGIPMSTPEEQAYPLVFLCSDAASYINGQPLYVDGGYIGAGMTGGIESALVDNLVPRLS